jgi:CDP-diacylglycerol--glycerol-3-phosphate 3-phosphatidyltransferase
MNDSEHKPQSKRLTFSQWGRKVTSRLIHPIVRQLARWRFTPTLLTVIGLLVNMVAGALLGLGQFRFGAAVLLLLGPVDALDGALARYLGQTSKAGAFLDSTFDRLSEIALYLGLLWHFQNTAAEAEVILIYLVITGSLMVSYSRARAGSLDIDCQIGILTRMERFLILVFGLFTHLIVVALTVLAVFSYVTVVQRVRFTLGQLGRQSDGSQ